MSAPLYPDNLTNEHPDGKQFQSLLMSISENTNGTVDLIVYYQNGTTLITVDVADKFSAAYKNFQFQLRRAGPALTDVNKRVLLGKTINIAHDHDFVHDRGNIIANRLLCKSIDDLKIVIVDQHRQPYPNTFVADLSNAPSDFNIACEYCVQDGMLFIHRGGYCAHLILPDGITPQQFLSSSNSQGNVILFSLSRSESNTIKSIYATSAFAHIVSDTHPSMSYTKVPVDWDNGRIETKFFDLKKINYESVPQYGAVNIEGVATSEETGSTNVQQKIRVRILDGPNKGKYVHLTLWPSSKRTNLQFRDGDACLFKHVVKAKDWNSTKIGLQLQANIQTSTIFVNKCQPAPYGAFATSVSTSASAANDIFGTHLFDDNLTNMFAPVVPARSTQQSEPSPFFHNSASVTPQIDKEARKALLADLRSAAEEGDLPPLADFLFLNDIDPSSLLGQSLVNIHATLKKESDICKKRIRNDSQKGLNFFRKRKETTYIDDEAEEGEEEIDPEGYADEECEFREQDDYQQEERDYEDGEEENENE